MIKLLAVSDTEVDMIYSPLIVKRFGDANLLISCGDLPFYYLEYMVSMLNRPLYYVNGNHTPHHGEQWVSSIREAPWGGVDIHRRAVRDSSGLLLAGIEGSLRYNMGYNQYTQAQMWSMTLGLVPKLLLNRLLYGRFLDIFVTHAPGWKIHDRDDLPHQGIKAFSWLVRVFQPEFHLHGHIHIYTKYEKVETLVGNTWVVNACGYKVIQIPSPAR